MSQCVPSWDFDVPSFDGQEVAELTWQNGELALSGLANKPDAAVWDKPRAVAGTLESIVNQAGFYFGGAKPASDGGSDELAPWFDHRGISGAAMTMDALVPVREHVLEVGACGDGESTRVASCSGATVPDGGAARPAGIYGCESESTADCGRFKDGRQLTATTTFDTTRDGEFGGAGLTSTSVWLPENTSSSSDYAKTTSVEDHDSGCHSRPQNDTIDEEVHKGKGIGIFKVSTKRSKATAIHTHSERRRRDRINQRMKTLQKLVPNSTKSNKASMLDEVIEYVKQLQAQLQISRMYVSQMMMLQQYFYMSMMGMRTLDMNTIGRATVVPPFIPVGLPNPVISGGRAAFMPMALWNIQGDRLPPNF